MAQKDKLIRTTAMVTLVIVLSKLFGLARDVITAGAFGTSIENDAYASAYTLFYFPVLLFNSCITATIVPLFVEEREKFSLAHSNRFASNALNLFLLAALVIAAVMYIFAEPIVKLIFRFDARGIELTVQLTRIMLLGLAFNVTSIVFSSLLNAMEKFLAAQLTGFPLSVCVMVSVLIFSKSAGVAAIAWGVFAASVLQALIQVPFLLGWFKYEPVIDFADKRFHRLLRLAGPAVLSMGISEVNHLIDRSLASGLVTGSISAMNYAYKLITFLLGVLMVPLTTVMFSRMSRLAAENDSEGVLAALRRSLSIILMVTLPIIAVAMVMSNDVVAFIFQRGSFTRDSVLMTGSVLLFYLIGVPAFGLRDLMNRTFHALQDTKTPFRVACLVVAMNIVLNLILRVFMGARGLALATSVSSYCGLAVMFICLRRRLGHLRMSGLLPELGKILLAAAISAAACWFAARLLPQDAGMLKVLLRLVVSTAAAFIVYVAMCLLLRVKSMRDGFGAVTAKVMRKTGE